MRERIQKNWLNLFLLLNSISLRGNDTCKYGNVHRRKKFSRINFLIKMLSFQMELIWKVIKISCSLAIEEEMMNEWAFKFNQVSMNWEWIWKLSCWFFRCIFLWYLDNIDVFHDSISWSNVRDVVSIAKNWITTGETKSQTDNLNDPITNSVGCFLHLPKKMLSIIVSITQQRNSDFF